jgi:hypothetical protein
MVYLTVGLATSMGVWQGMANGLPRISTGSAMPYPSTPCRRATPETTVRRSQGRPICRLGSLRAASSCTLFDTPRHAHVHKKMNDAW